jgi:hypothetical protein
MLPGDRSRVRECFLRSLLLQSIAIFHIESIHSGLKQAQCDNPGVGRLVISTLLPSGSLRLLIISSRSSKLEAYAVASAQSSRENFWPERMDGTTMALTTRWTLRLAAIES